MSKESEPWQHGGADNQQERLDAQWITGFVDGEGCFHIGINRQPAMTLGWQVLPELRVVQHRRDEHILHRIKEYFGFGQVVVNHGDRKEWRVRGLKNLNRVVSFFRKYSLQTGKKVHFETFAFVIEMMNKKKHLTKNGLNSIAQLSSTMNKCVTPRYLESPETIRQTSL
ncbi:endonuclease [Candidatus Woesearchaeota archaeon]|nr:endonuclease [Candidatus Woesearchaeota archaeon]